MQFIQQDEPLVGEWKLQRYRDMLHGKALYVACDDTCLKMAADEWVEMEEQLSSCFCMHDMLQKQVRRQS